jgi:hypothetical protein
MLEALWLDFERCIASVSPLTWFVLGAALITLIIVKAAHEGHFE